MEIKDFKEKTGSFKKTVSKGLFLAIQAGVKFFYPVPELKNTDNLPEEAFVYVGNHAQMNGPITAQLYYPGKPYIWTIGEMMNLKEVPAYAYEDFWRHKKNKLFYKALSYIIAPLSVIVFNNARTIAVYHDARLLKTIRESMDKLDEGKSIVIFPENRNSYNNIVDDFEEHFVDLARYYYRKSKKRLVFVPVYHAVNLNEVYFGKGIKYNPDNSIDTERERICDYLKKEITNIAVSLPVHKVIPYDNIGKKNYVLNKAEN